MGHVCLRETRQMAAESKECQPLLPRFRVGHAGLMHLRGSPFPAAVMHRRCGRRSGNVTSAGHGVGGLWKGACIPGRDLVQASIPAPPLQPHHHAQTRHWIRICIINGLMGETCYPMFAGFPGAQGGVIYQQARMRK